MDNKLIKGSGLQKAANILRGFKETEEAFSQLEKANHKYFRREGSPGNYKYYYTEEEYRKAKGKGKEETSQKAGENINILKSESTAVIKLLKRLKFSIKKSEKFEENVREDLFKKVLPDNPTLMGVVHFMKQLGYSVIPLSRLDLVLNNPTQQTIHSNIDEKFSISTLEWNNNYSSKSIAFVKMNKNNSITAVNFTYGRLTLSKTSERNVYGWVSGIKVVDKQGDKPATHYTNSFDGSVKASNVKVS